VQTVIFASPAKTKIDIDGNGSITLRALNPDEAMNLAKEQLKRIKAG